MNEPKGAIAVVDGPRHIGKKCRPTSMTMYTDSSSPKVKHLAHAGNVVQYFIFMGKVVHEVWLYMG